MDKAWTLTADTAVDPSSLTSTQQAENRQTGPLKPLRRARGRPQLHPLPLQPLQPPPSAQSPSPTSTSITARNMNVEARRPRRSRRKRAPPTSPADHHEQHLHRNRVAASKYRQRHKIWTDGLVERCQVVSEKRKQLQDLTSSLRQEVLSLKEQAIQQSSCDCVMMRVFLERQAINLLGLDVCLNQPIHSPLSFLATTATDSIPPSSSSSCSPSSFTSSFDDNFFSDYL